MQVMSVQMYKNNFLFFSNLPIHLFLTHSIKVHRPPCQHNANKTHHNLASHPESWFE